MSRFNISTLSREMLSGAAVATIDQAMLSATNMLIGLSFLRFASKVDYGVYVQLFALLMLSQSLQNALVNGPMVPMAPKRRARGMRAIAAHLFRLQTVVSVILVCVAFTGIEVASLGFHLPALPHSVALLFSLALGGQWLREFVREYNFLRLLPHATLVIDLLYVFLMALGLGLGIALDRFNTDWVFGSMACANFVAGFFGMWRTRLRPFAIHGEGRKTLSEAWTLSRWTLPSVVISWGSNWTFVYIVAWMVGVAAAADVSAARLLLMPVALCTVAWTSVFVPRASRWVGRGELDVVIRVVRWSVLGLWLLILGYTVTLVLAYGLLQTWVLGPEYGGLRTLTLAWALFFLINVLRAAATLSLVGGGHYRALFVYTCIAFVLGIPLVVALTHVYGSLGAVLGLAASEFLLAMIIWLHGWPLLKRRWGPAGEPGAQEA